MIFKKMRAETIQRLLNVEKVHSTGSYTKLYRVTALNYPCKYAWRFAGPTDLIAFK